MIKFPFLQTGTSQPGQQAHELDLVVRDPPAYPVSPARIAGAAKPFYVNHEPEAALPQPQPQMQTQPQTIAPIKPRRQEELAPGYRGRIEPLEPVATLARSSTRMPRRLLVARRAD